MADPDRKRERDVPARPGGPRDDPSAAPEPERPPRPEPEPERAPELLGERSDYPIPRGGS